MAPPTAGTADGILQHLASEMVQLKQGSSWCLAMLLFLKCGLTKIVIAFWLQINARLIINLTSFKVKVVDREGIHVLDDVRPQSADTPAAQAMDTA